MLPDYSMAGYSMMMAQGVMRSCGTGASGERILDPSQNEERVIKAIRAVFANKRQQAPALGPDTALDRSLGLESIDFAELAVRLEREFGEDPFADGDVPPIRSIRDLAALYSG
jgi:acyl carrier protein